MLLALGEAKWQEPGAQDARLFLFGGAGFTDGLRERAATDPSVQLIGLDRLYYGS